MRQRLAVLVDGTAACDHRCEGESVVVKLSNFAEDFQCFLHNFVVTITLFTDVVMKLLFLFRR